MSAEYKKLVEQAIDLVKKRNLIKLKIAKLAIKACTIRHGGRSNGLYTLTDFSRDTGISFKRLSEWVIIYKMIVSKIPDEIKSEEDWNKAARLAENLAKRRAILNREAKNIGSKSTIKNDMDLEEKEILRMFKNISDNTTYLIRCDEYLKNALFNINKVDFAQKDDIKFLLNISDNIAIFENMINRINTRVEYLINKIEVKDEQRAI